MSRGAFTLIELMICLALLAIFLAIPMTAAGSLHWLSRESDYRFALRNARHQLETLRQTSYDRLPPQSLVVDGQGWVQLGQAEVVAETVRVNGQPPAELDAPRGRVRVTAAPGSRVTVDYRFLVPDRDEAHTVPTAAPFRLALRNGPIRKIVSVWLAQGDKLTPLPSSAFRLETGQLELEASLAGKVVVVDYLGEGIKNQVWGQLLDRDLRPLAAATLAPGQSKLMHIQESYGAGSEGQMGLTLLKPGDRL